MRLAVLSRDLVRLVLPTEHLMGGSRLWAQFPPSSLPTNSACMQPSILKTHERNLGLWVAAMLVKENIVNAMNVPPMSFLF